MAEWVCKSNSDSWFSSESERLKSLSIVIWQLLCLFFLLTPSWRDEMAEAQRTNKPSGKCHYCLMISKTCKEASKTIPGRGGPPKEEYLFINAEEEFFYEVRLVQSSNRMDLLLQFFLLFMSCKKRKITSIVSQQYLNILSSSSSQQAVIKFHYSVQEETDSCLSGRWSYDDAPMKPYRTVMLIPADRMPVVMDKLKDNLTVWT